MYDLETLIEQCSGDTGTSRRDPPIGAMGVCVRGPRRRDGGGGQEGRDSGAVALSGPRLDRMLGACSGGGHQTVRQGLQKSRSPLALRRLCQDARMFGAFLFTPQDVQRELKSPCNISHAKAEEEG